MAVAARPAARPTSHAVLEARCTEVGGMPGTMVCAFVMPWDCTAGSPRDVGGGSCGAGRGLAAAGVTWHPGGKGAWG